VALGKIQDELSSVVNASVDVAPKKGLKPALRQQVLQEAEVIYVV
jgi:predicted nucleotidyltransferase